MNRRALLRLGALLLVTLVSSAVLSAQQPPPRLIADNRTPYLVDVWVWNGQNWGFVSRLTPRTWQAFPNAASGSMWRAVFGQAQREQRVNDAYDPGYGGYQSVWWIQ